MGVFFLFFDIVEIIRLEDFNHIHCVFIRIFFFILVYIPIDALKLSNILIVLFREFKTVLFAWEHAQEKCFKLLKRQGVVFDLIEKILPHNLNLLPIYYFSSHA